VSKLITILKDDREKQGWDKKFLGYDFEIIRTRLLTGDYTISGMNELVTIERKRDWQEIAQNISTHKNRQNFIKLLRRMQYFPVRMFIVHDHISKIMRSQMYCEHVTGEVLIAWLSNIVLEYGIPVLPVGGPLTAAPIVRKVLKTIHDYHKSGRLFCNARPINYIEQLSSTH